MRDEPVRVLELRTVRGTGGGPEKTILLGTELTDRARYEITVCYIRDARDEVFHIDRRATQHAVDYVEVLERHSFDRSVWAQLKRLVRARRIDIVHAHDYKTDLLALLLGRTERIIPLATAHGWTGNTLRERAVYYPLDRWILARFPLVIAVSSEIGRRLVDAGAAPGKVVVVLNGIDPLKFRRRPELVAAARNTFGFAPDDVAIGAIGRLEPQKNFASLIGAFAAVRQQVPAARLAIAGDGTLREPLRQQITGAGLDGVCRLLGQVDDVPLLHHALDLFVQSSVYEGTPNAVLEAMAMETAIVATDAGGTAELARHGLESLVVPIDSTAALAQAMRDALQDPEGRRRRIQAARARVEGELSFAGRVRKVEAIYDGLTAHLTHLTTRQSKATDPCATR
jgi:glycosyltransferase involved in cell wall biosynthesis